MCKLLTVDVKVDGEIGGKTATICDVNCVRHRGDVNEDPLFQRHHTTFVD